MVLAKVFRRAVLSFGTIAQIAIGVAIIYFARKLQQLEFSVEDQAFQEVSCALDHNSNDPAKADDDSLCTVAYAGVVITFVLMLALSIVLCFTCELCGAGFILEVAVNTVLCIGWVTYASWVTESARKIDGWDTVPVWNDDNVQNARSNVVALSWAEAALTGIVAVTIFFSSCCCVDEK